MYAIIDTSRSDSHGFNIVGCAKDKNKALEIRDKLNHAIDVRRRGRSGFCGGPMEPCDRYFVTEIDMIGTANNLVDDRIRVTYTLPTPKKSGKYAIPSVYFVNVSENIMADNGAPNIPYIYWDYSRNTGHIHFSFPIAQLDDTRMISAIRRRAKLIRNQYERAHKCTLEDLVRDIASGKPLLFTEYRGCHIDSDGNECDGICSKCDAKCRDGGIDDRKCIVYASEQAFKRSDSDTIFDFADDIMAGRRS